MPNISSECKYHIGIDVSKLTLDIHCLEDHRTWKIENNPAAIKKFIQQNCDDLACAFVVIDMAGGYEKTICDLFSAYSICTHRSHPYRVKSFIRACGQLSKSDSIDARMLAIYGRDRKHDLEQYQPLEQSQQALKGLMERRYDLVKMCTSEKNRLQSPAADAFTKKTNKAVIKTIERQIQLVEARIDQLIDDNQQAAEKASILIALKGIGPQITRTIIALMPEIGTMSGKQAASLAGLAPRANDSGAKSGYRFIKGGRPKLRQAMLMAALSAARYDPKHKAHYQNLLAKGKKKLVAMVAIARKIIVIANAKVRDYAYLAN